MKKLTAKDLNERLHHMVYQRHEDGMGGWRESWERGESLWAAVQAVRGRDGFHADDVGGWFCLGRGLCPKCGAGTLSCHCEGTL